MRRATSFLFVSLLATWGIGCSTAARGSSGTCRTALPQYERSLGDALDSAGLAADLAASWAGRTGLTLATLSYDSVGALDTITVLSENLTAAEEAVLQSHLSARARSESESEPIAPVMMVLWDGPAPAPRRVGRFGQCAPEIRNREQLTRMIAAEAQGLRLQNVRTTRVMTLVGTNGRVTDVRIDESSGLPDADQAAFRVLNGALFVPARIEGIPVEVWASFPITFRPAR